MNKNQVFGTPNSGKVPARVLAKQATVKRKKDRGRLAKVSQPISEESPVDESLLDQDLDKDFDDDFDEE